MKTIITFVMTVVVAINYTVAQDVETYAYAKLKPVAYDKTELNGGFLGDIRTRSRDIGIATLYDELENHGYIENFRICAENRREKHIRRMNCNEFIYKHIAAMSWYSSESATSKILLDEITDIVLAAQQSDGYLNTYYENILLKEQGEKRFAPTNRCELLNFGHFAQGAIANYRATGETKLLEAAIRFADLIVNSFADPNDLPYTLYQGPVNKKYEHANHELAMVELYRVTGDKRYLDFAMQTITEYGYFDGEHFNEMWGHAVCENLLEAGAIDIYLENGDKRIFEVNKNLWKNATQEKMYITGGTGSVPGTESYGEPYQLPNETAYSETCAAIALFFWHHKMLLATGDAKYADEMDRALYNNILAGYGLDGKSYFYMNPLIWNESNPKRPGHRFEWHHCPCCPPYIHRLLSKIDQYIYTYDESSVQVNLYADSKLEHKFSNGKTLTLSQKSAYPYGEETIITLDAPEDAKGKLKLRIPSWCNDPLISIDGKSIKVKVENGYAVLNQPWKQGHKITLKLPMEPMVIDGDSRVADQVNHIAIQRGPLIYCMEQVDNKAINFATINFSHTPTMESKEEPNVLNGVTTISIKDSDNREITMIPYYAWANREEGNMMVWLPTKE